jgi:hypothetical protein
MPSFCPVERDEELVPAVLFENWNWSPVLFVYSKSEYTLHRKKRCRTELKKGSEKCNEFETLFRFRTNMVSYQTIFYSKRKRVS